MCWPPLIDSVEPVMKPPSSETRNSTPRAISLGLAEPADRNAGDDLLQHVGRHGAHHVGVDIAGRDRVDGDALGGTFLRQRLGEAVDAGLGGGVVHLAVLPGLAVDRADIDDAAEIALAHAVDDDAGTC